MKNDKKNRRNKNTMTQDYDYSQTDDKNGNKKTIIVEMIIKMVIRLINTDDKNNESYKNDDK